MLIQRQVVIEGEKELEEEKEKHNYKTHEI